MQNGQSFCSSTSISIFFQFFFLKAYKSAIRIYYVCVYLYVSEFKEWDFKKEIQQTMIGVFLLYIFANLVIVIVDFGHGEVELLHIPELILGSVFSACLWLLKQRHKDFKHTCRRIKDKLMRYKMSEVKFLCVFHFVSCFFF